MSDTPKRESVEDIRKRERTRLRAQQRKLRRQFLYAASSLTESEWKEYAADFAATLKRDELVEYYSLSTDRYLIGIVNLMMALGFRIHAGAIPRVSGVDNEYSISLIAYDDSRLVIIDDYPENLFATLADVQPVSPLPVLGLLYNSSIVVDRPKYDWTFTEESILRSKRLASALALGYFTLSLSDLRLAMSLSPFSQAEELIRLAARLGLDRFLRPPIDALPVYGEFISRTNSLKYDMAQFLKDAAITQQSGARLERGDVTQASPQDASARPDEFFRELEKAKLLGGNQASQLAATGEGFTYLKSRVLPFPLGQLLNFTCYTAREEVRRALQSGFMDALAGRPVSIAANPLFIPVEDFDSFARINVIAPATVQSRVPVTTPEAEIKKLIHSIMGDPFPKNDWGGEQNDIFTSRIVYRGKRVLAAFLLKGPAVTGRLTIAKCGKNGDQIQRLFQSPADVFFIQYNGVVDERVFEEARQKATSLRLSGRPDVSFGIIDGLDTARLIAAYGPRLAEERR